MPSDSSDPVVSVGSGEPQKTDANVVAPSPKEGHNWWDGLGSVTAFISSVVIGGAGLLATHLYNDAQLSLKKEEIAGQLELKKREIDGQLVVGF